MPAGSRLSPYLRAAWGGSDKPRMVPERPLAGSSDVQVQLFDQGLNGGICLLAAQALEEVNTEAQSVEV